MRKIFLIVVGVIFLLLTTFVLARNHILKKALPIGVKSIIGLDMRVKNIDIGLFKPIIDVEDLEILNPQEFSDQIMVIFPEIYADYDLGALLKGKVHLRELRLNVREFQVVTNKSGRLNLDSLKVVQQKIQKLTPQGNAPPPEIKIDLLHLKIGKVLYKDYKGGTPAKVSYFNVNLDERFENITDPSSIVSLILVKALAKTNIAGLARFNIGILQNELNKTVGTVSETAQGAVQKVKGLGTTAQETVEKTGQDLKKLFQTK
ncbi:MAG: hypothetical protein WDL87_10790 [Candidatus Omnitrophota bacterium]|jgi:hypothetical protein